MTSRRLDKALEGIVARYPDRASSLVAFARVLFARGAAYADQLPSEALVELVADAFAFFARREAPIRWRVFNPTWDAASTIVETHLVDRPFVVDTVRIFLDDHDLATQAMLHPIVYVERDADGALRGINPAAVERGVGPGRSPVARELGPPDSDRLLGRESFVHAAVARVADAELGRLERDLAERLEDLRLATDDHPAMLERLAAVRAEIEARRFADPHAPDDIHEVIEFLGWLADEGFVFLGARAYALVEDGGRAALEMVRGSGLGILRREERSTFASRRFLDELPPTVAERVHGGPVLSIARTNAESRVHRKAQMDSIRIKRFDDAGRVSGEHRFLGLFTSKAYAEEPAETPILRRKLERILAEENAIEDSHDWKEIVAIFNTIPKIELLTLSVDELRADLSVILAAQRSDEIRVTFRPDAFGRGLSVMVILPRERFSAEIQREVAELLSARIDGRVIDQELALGDTEQARLHFYLVTPSVVPLIRAADLEHEIADLIRTWDDRFVERMVAEMPEDGRALSARYLALFDEEYKATTDVAAALDDVAHIEDLARGGGMRVNLVNAAGGEGERFTTIKIYRRGQRLVLSDFLPVLETFGLRVFEEDSIDLGSGGDRLYLDRFQVQKATGERLDVGELRSRLGSAIVDIQERRLESDALNRLVVDPGLTGREVDLLRTYRNLAFQAGTAPSRKALTEVLTQNPVATRALFDLIAARFRPDLPAREDETRAARQRFLEAIESVATAGEDRMLRNYLALVEATVRTTFYRPAHPEHPSIAIKVRSQELDFFPKPRPLFEIYVHSARMEGCHLRGAKVARGGIRWSDRHDDFRTEVLGLMKTQMVKNAVIVPAGSKGGFIVKRPAAGEAGAAEVRECYATLMRGLLDLTDNIVRGRVVPPPAVVRWDDDDPYLVVAADKGTATFSDLANSISEGAGFWLGDAFASGGSQGYDHKKEGITARGAWECVRHHFHALGKDIQKEPFTVVGIGDMGGDVFGNGMLLSPVIRLRAAFNHAHVFLDPEPDPETSFRERERLFRQPRSQWTDYDPKALGPGGAVISRTAKAAPLSPAVRAMLGVAVERLDGEGLVGAILAMETELLYNGGIGTYVRASGETHAEVGDAANDAVRITAAELRAAVVGEGGNLGFTQRARIEASIRGVRLNTDAIDNSAGVDLSDHEVNLKILFRPLIESGELTAAHRNRHLEQAKGDVIRHVLEHNRRQAWLLTLDQRRSRTRLVEFREAIAELEAEGLLDRVLEGLPDRDATAARRSQFLGLARPEIAVVLAYAKISLQLRLLASERLDDPYFERFLLAYFPSFVAERFHAAATSHRLRREIVSSELVNQTIDRMGSGFAHRLARDTGCDAATAVAAYAVVLGLTDVDRLWDAITRAEIRLEDAEEACLGWQVAVEGACALLIETPGSLDTLGETVERWQRPVAEAADALERSLPSAAAEEASADVARLEKTGLDAGLARSLVSLRWLRPALEVVIAGERAGRGLDDAVAAYVGLGGLLDFATVDKWLADPPSDDRWERRAAAALRQDVSTARAALVQAVLREVPERGSVADGVRSYLERREPALAKVRALSEDSKGARRSSLAGMVILARELAKLAQQGGER